MIVESVFFYGSHIHSLIPQTAGETLKAWVLSHNLIPTYWDTLTHVTIQHMQNCLRHNVSARSQNSMLQSKGNTPRARACNAWGLSTRSLGGPDKIHIPDSNLLLETKGCETEDLCHHPGQPFSIQLPYYVWTNTCHLNMAFIALK